MSQHGRNSCQPQAPSSARRQCPPCSAEMAPAKAPEKKSRRGGTEVSAQEKETRKFLLELDDEAAEPPTKKAHTAVPKATVTPPT